MAPFLRVFYNKLFSDGIFPLFWEENIILPLFKDGIHEVKHFRGITLNNTLPKINSKLLVNRLTAWSEKNVKNIDNQYYFQKNKSTADCTFVLHAVISKLLSIKNKLYVAFLDWKKKMYDKIDRTLIWKKIENIRTKLIKAMKSMYCTVKTKVKYNYSISETITSYNRAK